MPANTEHEHTLNVRLAELLRRCGLNARQERKQANRRRIDVEIHVGNVKIALEAEQGQNSTKQRDAIADADGRLQQGNADCAIAVCYPDFTAAGDAALTHLAAAYAAHATDLLLPLPQMNECSTRQSLDQAMCTDLDLDPETVATIHRHLAAEPSITAQRYIP